MRAAITSGCPSTTGRAPSPRSPSAWPTGRSRWNRSCSGAGRRALPHPDIRSPVEPQPVILITYATTEAAIRAALETIKSDGHIVGEPQMIRIEAVPLIGQEGGFGRDSSLREERSGDSTAS